MRLDKYISNLKYGTRKEVGKLIKKGLIKVNEEIVRNTSYQINPDSDKVYLEDELLYFSDSVLLMLHKPKGYVSANKDNLHKTVFELIKEPYNRFDLNIAGRLDIDTEGLLLLTNNGKILHNIISPKKDVYKKYYVEVDKSFNFEKLLKPFEILDGKEHPYIPSTPIIEKISDTSLYLSIKEGKFHQVKRMVKHFNRTVTYLKRVSVGSIDLGDLPLGDLIEIEDKQKRLFE